MAMPSVLPSTNLTPLPNFTVAEQIESKHAALGGASGFLGPAQTELVRDPASKATMSPTKAAPYTGRQLEERMLSVEASAPNGFLSRLSKACSVIR